MNEAMWKQFSVVGTTLMQLWSVKKTDWESTREPSMWKQFSVVGTSLMQLWSGRKTDWESTREPSMEWRQKLMQPWSSD